ncbi:MAG: leucine-rich repeat protein [Clostridia bacterium]|nr:leucine-rich repeat protein [Clostridia bacterium]
MLKKIVAIILASTFLFCTVPFELSASAAETFGVFTYTVNGDTVKITGCSKDEISGTLEIPSEIDGKPVTSLSYGVFENCTNLESVIIPDSVTTLDSRATYWDDGGLFQNCKNLTSVTLSENMTNIPVRAFAGCTSLTDITVPNSVTSIGYYAFSGCTALDSVNLSEGQKSLANGAFNGCTSLSAVSLPESLETIGSSAFYKCPLTSIEIPENVTTIGESAFDTCKLTSVTFKGSNVTSIGNWAFATNPFTAFTLPEGVTTFGYGVFKNCNKLESIVIPNSVTTIASNTSSYYGEGIFQGCTNLKSAILSENLTSVPVDAFSGCISLKTIRVPAAVESIKSHAFKNCTNLRRVVIEGDETQIALNAFDGCTALTDFPRPAITVTGVMIKEAGIGGEHVFTADSLSNYNISVKNSSGEEVFVEARAPYIAVSEKKVSAGETLSLTLTHKKGYTHPKTVEITLDDSKKAEIEEITVDEMGYLSIPDVTADVKAVLYKPDGSFFKELSAKNGKIVYKYLSGSYTVCIINTKLENFALSSIDEYAAKGLTQNEDYFVYDIDVEDNTVSVINLDRMPANSDGKLSCISSFNIQADTSSVSTLGYIPFTITYSFKDFEGFTADSFTLRLSDNMTLRTDSVVVNGKLAAQPSVSGKNNTEITRNISHIPLGGQKSGTITFNAAPTKGGSAFTVTPTAVVVSGGKTVTEKLANYSCTADFVTLYGDTVTNSFHTNINGVCTPNDTLKVYVNGTYVKSITADKKGCFKDQIALTSGANSTIANGTVFSVKVVTSGGTESETLKVCYNYSAPVLEKVIYHGYKDYDLTPSFFDGSQPIIVWEPYRDTFEIEISNSDTLSSVVITGGVGQGMTKSCPATRNGTTNTWTVSKANISGPYTVSAVHRSASAGSSVSHGSGSSSGGGSSHQSVTPNAVKYIREGVYATNDITSFLNSGANNDVSGMLSSAAGLLGSCGASSTFCDAANIACTSYDMYQIAKRSNEFSRRISDYNGPDKSTAEFLGALHKFYSGMSVFAKTLGSIDAMGAAGSFDDAMLSSVFDDALTNIEIAMDVLCDGNSSGAQRIAEGSLNDVNNSISPNLWQQLNDFIDDFWMDHFGSDAKTTKDPSGYIYEAIPENRVEGATVSIYYKETEDAQEQLWNAEDYEQENCIVTGKSGIFAWFVNDGWFKVVAEKDGYETASSEWMYVPPERTDVYIPIYDRTAPNIESAVVENGVLTLTFDKFMKTDSVTPDTVTVTQNGEEIECTFTPVWDEEGVTEQSGYDVAKRFVITPADGSLLGSLAVGITVDNTAQSYAGTYMESITSVEARVVREGEGVKRIAGASRVDTSLEVAGEGWDNADTVILTNGYNFADALAGGPLSYALDAPILLTANKATLEQSVIDKINALGTTKVIILGGVGAVNANIEAALAASYSVERVFGASRFDTAVAIAEKLAEVNGEYSDSAFIAYGYNYPDALAASSVAAISGAPILFAKSDGSFTDSTAAYISDHNVNNVTILGGVGAVGADAEGNLAALGAANVERVFGTSRYDTAFAIVRKYADLFTGDDIVLATGASFPDALAGGAFAAKIGAPLLLTHPNGAIEEIKNFVLDKEPANIYILGGTGAVPDSVIEDIFE